MPRRAADGARGSRLPFRHSRDLARRHLGIPAAGAGDHRCLQRRTGPGRPRPPPPAPPVAASPASPGRTQAARRRGSTPTRRQREPAHERRPGGGHTQTNRDHRQGLLVRPGTHPGLDGTCSPSDQGRRRDAPRPGPPGSLDGATAPPSSPRGPADRRTQLRQVRAPGSAGARPDLDHGHRRRLPGDPRHHRFRSRGHHADQSGPRGAPGVDRPDRRRRHGTVQCPARPAAGPADAGSHRARFGRG